MTKTATILMIVAAAPDSSVTNLRNRLNHGCRWWDKWSSSAFSNTMSTLMDHDLVTQNIVVKHIGGRAKNEYRYSITERGSLFIKNELGRVYI